MFKQLNEVDVLYEEGVHLEKNNLRKYSDSLGRYYTPENIAFILCKIMGFHKNKKVLDLGCGTGNLIKQAEKNWVNCNYHAFDIDQQATDKMALIKNENITIFNMDIINNEIPKKEYDIGISNPPYTYLKIVKDYKEYYSTSSLKSTIYGCNRIPTPFIFLNKLIEAVKPDGIIGVIFPTGLLSNKTFRNIREILIKDFHIMKVIELEPYSFSGTETHAHIIIIKNSSNKNLNYPIQFYQLNDYKLTNPFLRKSSSCLERLDYSYQKQIIPIKEDTIKSLINKTFRGKKSSKEIKKSNINVFHTTNFNEDNFEIDTKFIQDTYSEYFAKAGDILLARVGRNFHKKIAIVKIGYVEVSDCVIVIRPKEGFTLAIANILKHPHSAELLISLSQGTGAKYITYQHLLSIPIISELLQDV